MNYSQYHTVYQLISEVVSNNQAGFFPADARALLQLNHESHRKYWGKKQQIREYFVQKRIYLK